MSNWIYIQQCFINRVKFYTFAPFFLPLLSSSIPGIKFCTIRQVLLTSLSLMMVHMEWDFKFFFLKKEVLIGD